MSRDPEQFGAMPAIAAINKLRKQYGMTLPHAKRTVEIAVEYGVSCQTFGSSLDAVTVQLREVPKLSRRPLFEVYRGVPEISEKDRRRTTPGTADRRYTSGVMRDQAGWDEHMSRRSGKPRSEKKENTMAPRGKTAEPKAEAEAETELDLSVYLEKDITAKMNDYVEFVIDEVFGGDEKAFNSCDAARILYLGPTVYHFFQASDFNKQRTQERRDAKAASNGAAEEADEETPKPRAPRGRAAAKPAAPKPAAPKPAAPKRRRSKAAAAEPAPY